MTAVEIVGLSTLETEEVMGSVIGRWQVEEK